MRGEKGIEPFSPLITINLVRRLIMTKSDIRRFNALGNSPFLRGEKTDEGSLLRRIRRNYHSR